MDQINLKSTAKIIWDSWKEYRVLSTLPRNLVPRNRFEAYTVQSYFEEFSQQGLFGWKIAATSQAGQKHIGATGPMAGRILKEKTFLKHHVVDLTHNAMSVAELEFVFKMGKTIKPKKIPYKQNEVLTFVDSLYSGIEFPDSRFENFSNLGELFLIADNACANNFVIGSKLPDIWHSIDLSNHQVELRVKDGLCERGVGSNVLGDPRTALTWLVNELSSLNITLHSGEFVTTGTCTVPLLVKKGDHIIADYGELGKLEIKV